MRVVSAKGPTIKASFVIERASRRKDISEALVRLSRRKVKNIITRHYQTAGDFIASQLGYASGGMGGVTGGSRVLRGYDGSDRPFKFRTAYWPSLSYDYVKRRPVSRRFWRKRGKLYQFIRQDMRVRSMKAEVVSSTTKKVPQRNRLRVTHSVAFSPLANFVLNQLIAAPFVWGSASVASGFKAQNLSRENSELLGYPEAAKRKDRYGRYLSRRGSPRVHSTLGPVNRPWVAGASGELGQAMHRAVRRLK
jgi:hypothetical protein